MLNYFKTHRKAKYAFVAFCDVVSLLFSYVFSYITIFAKTSDILNTHNFLGLCVMAVMMLVVFTICGMHTIVFSYASMTDALRVAGSSALLFLFTGIFTFIYDKSMFGVAVVTSIVFAIIVLVLRFYKRFLVFVGGALSSDKGEKVIVIGAGAVGNLLLHEVTTSDKLNLKICCFIDSNKEKIGKTISGVRVFGNIDSIEDAARHYNAKKAIIAIPSASRTAVAEMYAKCKDAGLEVQSVPGLYQLINGQCSIAKLHDVSIEDLLGRDQVKVNLDEIMGYIENKTVLVTGVGSIGSELCRQIATHNPKRLIMLDIYENNAYDIQQELRRHHPELDLVTLIASIRDKGKLESVFEKYRPNIVFNAAAHKHVPLMEDSPNEAVKNNVFGTLNMALCADKYGVSRFVQISTDKAVNPTNIMGATKRICEMIVQSVGRKSKTEFVAVRFGNVLGSNGSVIPLFKKQIEEGGPVTITHKDIIRYFMTIPEAVSLVLQAGAYAKGGEIYVLDMGNPVKIYDLALNLIRLSGLTPGVDIDIVCTGLRPGEKLFEERLMAEEGLQKTENELISIGKPLDIDDDDFFASLDKLYKAAYEETEDMKELVHNLVPTYTVDKR